MRRAAKWLGAFLLGLFVLLVVAAVVTARRGNPDLYPVASGAPRIEVFVVSNGYHAGLVLPRATVAEVAGRNGYSELIALAARFNGYGALEIGWGEEGFYTSVPTIASLTLSGAMRALFRPGNTSVLHVVGLAGPPQAMFPRSEMVRLDLSQSGFERLLARLDATFAPGQQDLGPGLYGPSRFYRAIGAFNLLHVCNHWVADMLDAAGVPTAPLLATVPAGLLLDLTWRAGATSLPQYGAR
jgi:uncharacterized protein (TIGR02117 family)